MSFLYPQFLWALSLLAIPIIIHLFNFRRYKKVYFTNVQFLREMKEQTTTRSRLKHILVLISRLLAVSFLVFAFAQPFIPKNQNKLEKTTKTVSVYIDNSFSMDATGEDQSMIEKAKRKAVEIAHAYNPSTQFQLITNDFEGRHQRLLSRDEFETAVDEVKVSPASRKLSEVEARQKQALSQSLAETKINYLLSDFQENITDIKPDTSLLTYLVPLQSNHQVNVSIDSCWFATPVQMLNQSSSLLVKISNHGDEKIESSNITLKINGQTKALSDFSVDANASVIDTMNFTIGETGWQQTQVSIEDYPITFDDNYYLVFYVADKVNLLSINEQQDNPYLDALFKDNAYFKLDNAGAGQLDYSSFSNYQLIVVNSPKNISSGLAAGLKDYISNGGGVLLFPNIAADVASYNSFLQSIGASQLGNVISTPREVSKINTEQEIFKDVFEKIPENINLPTAKTSFSFITSPRSGEEPLLKFDDNSSFLSRFGYEKGSLYLCATPLNTDQTDLPVHAIFVPMIYKMAISGLKQERIAYTIGKDNLVEVPNGANVGEAEFKIKGDKLEFTPSRNIVSSKVMLGIENQIQQAGFFQVSAGVGDFSDWFAMNFDRRESDMKLVAADKLKDNYASKYVTVVESVDKDFSLAIAEIDRGIALWKLCVIFTLLFLAFEVLLLRFLR